MPLTKVTYRLICDLKKSGLLPLSPSVLELGESNWYGDVTVEQLEGDVARFVSDVTRRTELQDNCRVCKVKLAGERPDLSALWELPRIFFKAILDVRKYTAIDLSGSEAALKLDLNQPVELGCQYDLVLDLGTAEHVFNVYQFFKTVHEWTTPGGIMVHILPFQGWVDHGFYNFHPTFYFDLAAANKYELISLVYWNDNLARGVKLTGRDQIVDLAEKDTFTGNGTLIVICRKSPEEHGFQTPMQGYYTHTISEKAHIAWHRNR